MGSAANRSGKKWGRRAASIALWIAKAVNAVVMFAAAVAAIWFVWVWWRDAPIREEEHLIRVQTQIQTAYATLDRLNPPDSLVLKTSRELQAAVDILRANRMPIRLEAYEINLDSMDLSCAQILLRGGGVTLSGANLNRTNLVIDAWDAELSGVYVESVVDLHDTRSGESNIKVRTLKLRGRMSATHVLAPDITEIDIEADNVLFSTPSGQLPLSGLTGRVSLEPPATLDEAQASAPIDQSLLDAIEILRAGAPSSPPVANEREITAWQDIDRVSYPVENPNGPVITFGSASTYGISDELLAQCPMGRCPKLSNPEFPKPAECPGPDRIEGWLPYYGYSEVFHESFWYLPKGWQLPNWAK